MKQHLKQLNIQVSVERQSKANALILELNKSIESSTSITQQLNHPNIGLNAILEFSKIKVEEFKSIYGKSIEFSKDFTILEIRLKYYLQKY
jgi:hypothetical protein